MSAHDKVLDEWMDLLDGNISVPVYRLDVPENEKGNFVIVRPEGGSGDNNKRSINDEFIIITDVVTRFKNNVNGSVADNIDAEIFDLVLPEPQGHGLDDPAGVQILNVRRESFNYLQESGIEQIYRKVSRYSMRVHLTN